MYVCVCRGITDSQVNEAIASGAKTLGQVRKQLGVASQCGQCGSITKQLIANFNDMKMDDHLFFSAV